MPISKQIHTERHRQFRALLVAVRKQRGLTQTQVAERLGKPPSYVAKIELGERRLDVLEFIDYANAIGFGAGKFIEELTGDGPLGAEGLTMKDDR